jgi:hypothetical protein
MSKLTKLAGVLPFAHLLGIKAESDTPEDEDKKKEDEAKRAEWAKKAESDDDRKQKDDESDEDYATRMEKMDDEEDKAKSKADEGEEEAKADDQDGSDGEEAKAERSRCAKIMAHGIKHGNAAQAGVFAFNTRMSVNAAIAALAAGASITPAKPSGLGSRMATVQTPKVGPDASQAHDLNDPNARAKATADAIIAAAAKARGEKV